MTARILIAATALAALTLPATAQVVDGRAGTARLTVLSDRYVLDGRQYFDTAALAAVLEGRRAPTVRIDNCAATWSPRLLATVARLHAHALDLRLADPASAECRPPALAPATMPGGETIDGADVARYWERVAP